MRRISIRKMMLVIAVLADGFGVSALVTRWVDRQIERGRRAQCEIQAKNVVLAILGYANLKGEFPAGTWPNPGLAPKDRLSWYGTISAYLDYPVASENIDWSQPWDVGINATIACMKPGVRCPGQVVASTSLVPTNYIGIAGRGMDALLLPKGDPRNGVFGYDRQTAIADVKDGLGTTMLVAESGRVSASWLAGGLATVRGLDPDEQPYLGSGRQFGGRHHGGAVIGLADGSVRFVSESIDPRIFEALSTIAGGEEIPDHSW